MNRKGFAYLIAVLILGLLAFMGLFLQQSSSTEYSQAAISVYRTMGRQLAEAAAEEACIMLEERFRDKTVTGFMQQLLWQASSSQPPKLGGATGLNPTLLHDFSDLKDKVTQVLTLKDYHMTRAGFTIEKILPSVKDLRPIPQGALDDDANYHHSPDRTTKFDNNYSRDWYLTIQLDVTVSLQKQRKFKIDYTISRDVKMLNLGPMARNYTVFSILGHRIPTGDPARVQEVLRHEMNMPDRAGGRMFLWNTPFQSRVYLHGPSIIALENPQLANDRPGYGAYNIYPEANAQPGVSNAYQYSDTFYGLSYFPTFGRAIFPPKRIWDSIAVWWRGGKQTKEDDIAHKGLFEKSTVYGGLMPKKGRSFSEAFGDISSRDLQDTYFRGTNINQKFMPGGPYCRTPWKYVSATLMGEDRYLPNSKEDYSGAVNKLFPKDDQHLRIEHRWSPDDTAIAEQSRIYARTYKIKYNTITNNITTPPAEEMMDFSLSYYNDPDPEGFLGKLGYSFTALGESFWSTMTLPFQAISIVASPLISRFWPGEDRLVSADAEQVFKNLFPSNFKYNFRGVATRKFKDETEIPRDENGRWLLNGIYWLDSFQLDESISYVGTGTILVSKYNPDRPFKIKGNIIAVKGSDGVTPTGHLNIFYHPYSPTATDISDRLLVIEGSGNCIEASVFSCYGLKTNGGDIADLTTVGMPADQPMDKWDGDCLTKVANQSNMIFGNYVNFFMSKNQQQGDLWVVHNFNSPLYFDKVGDKFRIVQERLDASEENRKAYELATHEFFLSPKIQHVGITGGSDE